MANLDSLLPWAAKALANTFAAKQTFATPASGTASINLPHGSAPSAPSDGDVWTTSTGMYLRTNGATVGPFAVAGDLVPIEDFATTSGTSVVFDNIPATYKRLWLILQGVSLNGSGLVSGDYSIDNGTSVWTGLFDSASLGAANTYDAIYEIVNYKAAGRAWARASKGGTFDAKVITLSDNIDALRVSASGGPSFDAGHAYLFGEN